METTEQPPQTPERSDYQLTFYYTPETERPLERYFVTASEASQVMSKLNNPFVDVDYGPNARKEKRQHIGFSHAKGSEWLPLDNVRSVRVSWVEGAAPKPAAPPAPSFLPQLIEQIGSAFEVAEKVQAAIESMGFAGSFDPRVKTLVDLVEGVQALHQIVNSAFAANLATALTEPSPKN